MLKRLLAKPILQHQIDDLIGTELKFILEACSPLCIFLFGSAARGAMTTASDLDLLIIMPDNSNLKEIKNKFYCRRPPHDWPVDVIFMHKSQFDAKSLVGGIPMICRQEGKIIFGELG